MTTSARGTGFFRGDPDPARRLSLDAPDRYLILSREICANAQAERTPRDAEHVVALLHGHACALADRMQIRSAVLPAGHVQRVNRALAKADTVLWKAPDASPAGLQRTAQAVIDLYEAGEGWLECTS
ncbi:hypothetical protein [Streptomyces sp. S5]|uniref:hypothetical protein n=1 Tax=Streptomyces sp. S5 TaxID=1456735 RepID=UPI000EF92B3D|nr:hypothetical protein [Streptomyces sp. S5]